MSFSQQIFAVFFVTQKFIFDILFQYYAHRCCNWHRFPAADNFVDSAASAAGARDLSILPPAPLTFPGVVGFSQLNSPAKIVSIVTATTLSVLRRLFGLYAMCVFF